MRLEVPELKTSTGARRRGAVDGLRGIFVTLVLLYHFGATALVGGWVGLNHFFVFSGYLIARLLISERARYGAIKVSAFYRRRAERLVPALLVLCGAVLLVSLTESSSGRHRSAGDVLATLFFVQNWRLVSQEDAYFEQVGNPSPLRHAWTLGVEEQFYVLVPLLIIVVFALARTRRARVLLTGGLTLAATVWTAQLADGGASFPRLYYGTDTRAQALLLGATLAFALGRDERGRLGRKLSVPATQAIGVAGVVISFAAFFVINPRSDWLFTRGGMLLFAAGAGMMVYAAFDQRPMLLNDLLSWRPIAVLGQMTYGLYLYHWPIHLWVGPSLEGLPLVLSVLVQLGLTVLAAVLSFRFLEVPVLERGFGYLLPRRGRRRGGPAATGRRWWALPVAGTLVVALAAWGLWSRPVSEEDLDVPPLVAGQAPFEGADPPVVVGLVGDSVGASLAAGWRGEDYPGVTLSNQSRIGCDLIDAPQFIDGSTVEPDPSCATWRAEWPQALEDAGARDLVVLAGAQFIGEHEVDGQTVAPQTPEGARLVRQTLTQIESAAAERGVTRVQVVTVPCREVDPAKLDPTLRSFAGPLSDPASTAWVNETVTSWAKGEGEGAEVTAGVSRSVLDLWEPLCSGGFQPEVNGVPLYHDTVHFSPAGAAMVWTWLTPRVVDASR